MPVFTLPGHEFIEVSGPDARDFLQGQVSCNVDLLAETRSLPGALCNLKGRVIADFRLVQSGDACLLQTGGGMADKIIATLSRYAVFSKVELRQFRPPLVIGVLGGGFDAALARLFPAPPATINECAISKQMCLLRLPGERLELWCLDEAVISAVRELLGEYRAGPGQDWLAAELAAGVAHVGPAISEQYTPQLLNYDVSGVINFSKGCYTGQEVVARMHFRGKPKKRMFLFSGKSEFDANSRICEHAEENPDKGEPVLAHANPGRGRNLALAVANIEAAAVGRSWYLDGRTAAPLQATPLAYDCAADSN